MKAIFVNECGARRYASGIAAGIKTIETRSRDMLKTLLGERVAIIRTGCGVAHVIGYVDIISKIQVNEQLFDVLADRHLVPCGDQYDIKPGGKKYCYFLENAERCEPYPVPENAIRHGRSWCEW